ncbi:MAG: DUF5008 domain-containing protein [Mucilaginibacter polytrichastri]|nr:DUF5008 domain-containing protein [Mucilaginibacter polytrichastri]
MKSTYLYLFTSLLVLSALAGCKKDDTNFTDPYSGGREALGIVLNVAKLPSPSRGNAGATIRVDGTGLLAYKDQLKFYFNGEPAEVIKVDESGIDAKVPDNASSGIVSVTVGDQVFFGPRFVVTGLINIDPTFRATSGTNGPISHYYGLPDGRGIIVGSFSNYDNKGAVRRLNNFVRVSPDGDLDRSLNTGVGPNGSLSSFLNLNNRYFIAGGFSGYDLQVGRISNITQLNTNGTIDTVVVTTGTGKQRGVPIFNGGTDGFIENMGVSQGKIVISGGFRYYFRRRYNVPSRDGLRDSVIIDSTRIGSVIRLNADGSLDRTYRFNATTGQGLLGTNGFSRTLMLPDGKLLVYGRFTRFDDAAANNVVRLNADGTIDNTFTFTKTTTGISSITYNATTKKYFLTGLFPASEGSPATNLALINENGSVDPAFIPKTVTGYYVDYGKQLSDGKFLISGVFNFYGNINRNGFAVLEPNGDLATGYNAIGNIRSAGGAPLSDVIETRSADNKRALLLLGYFNEFDNLPAYNILRVTLE